MSLRTLAATESDAAPGLLGGLRRSSVLTDWQARWLADHGDGLPDDWASNPYFGGLLEHTRAYINRECAGGGY